MSDIMEKSLDAAQTVKRNRPMTKKELDSRSFTPAQSEKMEMPPLGQTVTRDAEVILLDRTMEQEYNDALAFGDEPVKIIIHRSQDKFKSQTTDYIAVNGIAAEVLFKNGFVPIGYLPRGVAFITKRKYVEVLARAKMDSVQTTVVERDNEDPQNFIERVTSSIMAFSVLEDKNPRGQEWLAALINARG